MPPIHRSETFGGGRRTNSTIQEPNDSVEAKYERPHLNTVIRLLYGRFNVNQDSKGMNEQLPDFTDKSVVFYITTPPGAPDWFCEGLVLESPSFQKQNDRIFAIGQTPQEAENIAESDWAANREAGIAWDSVYYYVVLPSDEYQDARVKDASEHPEVPAESTKEVPNAKNSSRNYLLISFIIIGIFLPTALLVAIIVWIVKML